MMRSGSLTFIFACCMALGVSTTRADVVIDWNQVALQAIRTSKETPQRASRALAMTHTAIYDAVNSIDDTYQPYLVNLDVPGATSREAAAAQAAHDVLVSVYPAQSSVFDAALTVSLSVVPEGVAKADGRQLGTQVAASILSLRANDHAFDVVSYTPSNDPGRWRPTPSANAPAQLPNWPYVTPWSMTSGDQFRNQEGAPALTSVEYAQAFQEVKELGAANSATRTADQTNIALFWLDGAGTSTPPGHFNRIAQTVAVSEGNSLSENARMFALVNIAGADAAIMAWDNKYLGPFESFWRPITAIRDAEVDGNSDTTADPNWTPLVATPPHPSYTSGHNSFAGAMLTTLANFFGDDNIAFVDRDETGNIPDRTFTSFSQAKDEVVLARIAAGIHWRFDDEDGRAGGEALAEYIHRTQLLPVPEPSTLSLFILLGLSLRPRRRQR